MTRPRASLRSENCPISIGIGVRYGLEQVSDLIGMRIRKKLMRVVSQSPSGIFVSSKDGRSFCVLYGANVGWGIFGTNTFSYSDRLGQSRVVKFEDRPETTTVFNDHVFFKFRNTRVFDLNILTGSLEEGHMPAEADDFQPLGFKACDNRFVFFEGANAPWFGTKLVSSPWDEFQTREKHPNANEIRILKGFSRLFQGKYRLQQLSPDGRFALVSRFHAIGDEWGYTYLLVHVTTGQTWEFLKDEVPRQGNRKISEIYWVGGDKKPQ